MLCFKRFSYLFAFVFSVFVCTLLSTIITSGDVYATSTTFTVSTSNIYLCGGSSQYNCGDYNYIIFNPNDFNSYIGYISIQPTYVFPQGSATPSLRLPSYFKSVLYLDNISTIYLNSLPASVNSVEITLTDSISDCPAPPSGSLSITENGTYDVTNYASAVVDVPPIMGDYHDDLVNIKKAIYTGCAVLLVLYFFYCIYRMIIKGVKK